MNRIQRYGASQSHSSCCELIGHRRATDEVSAPHSLVSAASLRWKFTFLIGVSEFSRADKRCKVFQHGLQYGYISLHPYVKGGLQWRLVALKVPEARTQFRTIIVFTTPVRFSERDTHLVL